MPERTCPGCGVLIVPGTRERNPRKWCSEACRIRFHRRARTPGYEGNAPRCAVYFKNCDVCGSLFAARAASAVLCGRACVNARRAEQMRARYRDAPGVHRDRVRVARSAMSDEQREAAKAARQAWLERQGGRAAAQKSYDHVRRARLLGLASERFDPRDVFDRDEWRCGICGGGIDRDLRYPDPSSVSLDHVVPLSLGGPHTRANTRPAHLSCNVRRGNRLEVPDGWSRPGSEAC